MAKKFHTYATLAYESPVAPVPGSPTSLEEARDAFLIDLASFHQSLRKNLMVCEAEARQVEEYNRERERIGAYLPCTCRACVDISVRQRTREQG